MKSPEILFTLKNISCSYGKRNLFRNLDLSVEAGTSICIAGKSGAGKSTLLYVIGGLLKPEEGNYEFEGRNVYNFGEFGLGRFRRRNIGFVFQDFRLLPFLSVEKNIRFPLLFGGVPYSNSEIEAILNDLGIADRRKAWPADISGGEAQRTAIGRALALKPRVLLMDEPTGNLDSQTEIEIMTILERLKKNGLTIVMVTHSEKLMASADKVYHLKDGALTIDKPAGRASVKPAKEKSGRMSKKAGKK